MKKENPNQKNTNDEKAKNGQERPDNAKKDIRTKLQAKAAAEANEKKKKKKYVIAAVCCTAALVIAVAAAVSGISNKKPETPATVSSVSSEVTAEKTDTGSNVSEKDPADVRKQEKEPSKEQIDDNKTNDDKKETKGEENKDTKKPGTEEPSVSDTPDKPENGNERKPSEESSGNPGETKEPADTPGPESPQETPVVTPSVTDVPETPAPTQPPQEDIYLPAEPVVTTAPHVHTWQERIRTVHHEAVTEQVKVVDQAAYTEPVFEEQPVYETISVYICDVCGEEFESVGDHSETHIDWETFTNPFHYHVEFSQGEQIGTELVQTGTITHPEVSHMETKVITAAYDEQIPEGYVCTGCGAVK